MQSQGYISSAIIDIFTVFMHRSKAGHPSLMQSVFLSTFHLREMTVNTRIVQVDLVVKYEKTVHTSKTESLI